MDKEQDDIWAVRLHEADYKTYEPDKFIVDWVNRIKVKGHRALDIGCGWGRHLLLLHRAGYDAVGLDSSPGMLAAAKSKLIDEGFTPNLVEADAAHLPFPAEDFNTVLTTRTIFHGDRRFMVRCIMEIMRVLLPGGYLLGSFLSVNDWRYGIGIPVEKGTFVPDMDQYEPGIMHHFCDADELLGWLKKFEIDAFEEIFERFIPKGEMEEVRGAAFFVAARKRSSDDDSLEDSL